jgi:SAM-dependent methyltransferase
MTAASASPPAETGPVNLWTRPEWAQRYLRERDDIPHRAEGYGALLEHLLLENFASRPRRVLDLGTGDGYLLHLVRAAHPASTGVACDFSAEMLGHARERFASDDAVTVVEHDLDDPLPAAWGAFDAVVSSFAIHHVVDERKCALYGEVLDRLEPGGVFCNLEHVASATPELHVEFLAAIGKTSDEDDPSNKLVLVETQLGWLRDLGFEQVDCQWKWRELALLVGVKPAR